MTLLIKRKIAVLIKKSKIFSRYSDNELSGIPSAHCSAPEIEATFDSDANVFAT
jgi:hypothetical protein